MTWPEGSKPRISWLTQLVRPVWNSCLCRNMFSRARPRPLSSWPSFPIKSNIINQISTTIYNNYLQQLFTTTIDNNYSKGSIERSIQSIRTRESTQNGDYLPKRMEVIDPPRSPVNVTEIPLLGNRRINPLKHVNTSCYESPSLHYVIVFCF